MKNLFAIFMFVFSGLAIIGMVIIAILRLDELVDTYSKIATVGIFCLLCVFIGLLDLAIKKENK